jgi:hypothetical protein
MFGVRLKGKEVLSKEELEFLDSFLAKELEKVQRRVKDDFVLILKFAVHRTKLKGKSSDKRKGKKSKNKKYGVQARVKAIRSFDAGVSEWDFKKALHGVLRKIENGLDSQIRK